MLPNRFRPILRRLKSLPWIWMVSISFLPNVAGGIFEGVYPMMFAAGNPWLALMAALVGSAVTLMIMFAAAWSDSAAIPDEVVTIPHILDEMEINSLTSMTQLQAKEVNAGWRGKRLMVSGNIQTVTLGLVAPPVVGAIPSEALTVTLTAKPYHIEVTFNPNPWRETLKRMNAGDVLRVTGDIETIDRTGDLKLINGDVISHKRAWRIPFLS